MPLASGSTFAGYTIVRPLGSGGMGEVYLAQHPRLPRHDALKVLPAEISSDPEYRERFSREADLAAGLWHPNIVGVRDRGEYDGQLWITMEYVPGVNAAELLRRRYPTGMPAAEVAGIVAAVGDALDHAHSRGLLHRDVKPANIMISEPDHGEQRIMLADFGIARTIGEISGLTATNMTVGTVAYAAPEQLMGEHLDGRADQYALAATAYHLLSGSQLFPDTNPAVVIARHLSAPPPSVADIHPDLAAVDRSLAIALAKRPEDRFNRCSDFAGALVSAETDTATAAANRPAGAVTPRVRRGWKPRKRWSTVAAILAAASLTGAVLVALQPWKHSSSAENSARSNPVAAPSISAPRPETPPPADPPSTTAPDSTGTRIAMAVAVNETGERINGYQEEPPNPGNTVTSCDTLAPPAITNGVYNCSPMASDAHVCWPASAGTMLCLVDEDPWKKMLRRYTIDANRLYGLPEPLSTTSGYEPRPIALILDDGTRCTRGAARTYPHRDDGYFPAYDCGATGAVLGLADNPGNVPTVDQSQPTWTVQVGFIGEACGPDFGRACAHFPPPRTHAVATAFFPGIDR